MIEMSKYIKLLDAQLPEAFMAAWHLAGETERNTQNILVDWSDFCKKYCYKKLTQTQVDFLATTFFSRKIIEREILAEKQAVIDYEKRKKNAKNIKIGV